MLKWLICIAAQLLLVSSPHAGTQELHVNSFKQLNSHVDKLDKKTLIVIDVDGVILTTKDSFFSPINRKQRHKLFRKLESKLGKTEKKRLTELIFGQIEYKILDSTFIDFFTRVTRSEATVIALTSMGPNNRYVDQERLRVKTLKDLGYTFRSKDSFDLSINDETRKQPIVIEGIIFARGFEKGIVLKHYLKGQDYNKVIVIDDMSTHLISIKNNLDKIVQNLVLVEYKFDDYNNSNLDSDMHKFQIDYLLRTGIWLTDLQAKIAMKLAKE